MKKSGFIAIAGRPNVGKSTLLNRILGMKVSIVTPKAQTTRERVLGIYTEKEGQIVFIDTPGIHRAKEGGINEYMVNEAKEALDGPSVVWYLVDPASAATHEVAVLDLLKGVKAPIFLAINKVDIKNFLPGIAELQKSIEDAARERGIEFKKVVHISAQDGSGVNELLEDGWKLVPEGHFYFPDEEQVSDRPTRFFVSEKIREQLLLKLGDEVPYSCAIEIERFDESLKLPRIEAIIHVERDSQKGIVIGKGAAKIKEIGQAAREEIEDFMGTRVFLGLRVKVLKDWTKDAVLLERMGYTLPKGRRKTA